MIQLLPKNSSEDPVEVSEKKSQGFITPNKGGGFITPNTATQLYLSKEISSLKDSMTANFITILGIFSSFLAFLIIEIQILKTVCDSFRVLGFSLFILGAIFSFILFLLYFVDSQGKKVFHIVFLTIISASLIISGISVISKGDDEYVCKLNKLDGDFQKLQNDLREENEKWLEQKRTEYEIFKNLQKVEKVK